MYANSLDQNEMPSNLAKMLSYSMSHMNPFDTWPMVLRKVENCVLFKIEVDASLIIFKTGQTVKYVKKCIHGKVCVVEMVPLFSVN